MLISKAKRDSLKEMALLAQECVVPEWTLSKLKGALEDSNSVGFVACSQDTLMGSILGLFDRFQSEIHFLCVRPLWHNKGVGSCLLETFEGALRERRRASKEGIEPEEGLWVHLEVRASNRPARTLYEKNGYVFTRMRTHYYDSIFPGGEKEDAALYQKQLFFK